MLVYRYILTSELHKNGANNANIASEVDFNAYLYPWYTLGPGGYAQDLVSKCPVTESHRGRSVPNNYGNHSSKSH